MPKPSAAEVDDAMTHFGVRPDGPRWTSLCSVVGPVTLASGRPAFLKVTNEPDELSGADALRAWDGMGAVALIARQDKAMLLERAGVTMRSQVTDDDAVATAIICDVARRLHVHTPSALGFPRIEDRFRALFADHDPRFDRARAIAREQLAEPGPPVLLHGDLHSENVLASDRGWLAIDPVGVVGAREFDYCNLFKNWTEAEAIARFDTRLAIVTCAARIERTSLLRWIAAWSALSAVWHLADRERSSVGLPLAVLGLALARLDGAHG